MGKLADCLSTLSIIATSNIVACSEAQAAAAIENCLKRSPDGVERLRALRELDTEFEKLKLDGMVAEHIREMIRGRIIEIEAAFPSLTAAPPGRASSHSSGRGRG